MKKTVSLLALAITLVVPALPAHAIQPIPEATGFSGFVNVGVGVMESATNQIAGNNISDTGSNHVGSLRDSPDSETNALPILNFEANYTFADTRTQIYLGNQLEDLLRFDMSSVAGLRQELPDKGIVSLAYVFTAVPTSVWEDPYVVNAKRKKTDRSADGLRLGFDRILGTRLEAQFTWRDIAINEEQSGRTQLIGNGDLSAEQANSLDRNGDAYTGKLTRPFFFQKMRHMLIPTLEYSRYDLDGEAMAFDRYGMLLSYVFNAGKFNLITNLYYTRSDFDEENPIYDKTQEDDVLGASLTAFYKKFLGVPQMNLVGSVASYDSDSNINFYDTKITIASVSVLYRF